MTSQNDIDYAVEQVLGDGLESADEHHVLRQLDALLQQETESQALVLGGEPAPWVLGGASGGGFGTIAQRFLGFYGDAMYKEMCDPDKGQLKAEYRELVSGLNTKDRVKSLVPIVLTTIALSASLVNPLAIAALVALWLVKLGLDQWCALPRSTAESLTGMP